MQEAPSWQRPVEVGLYGKLPSHGDFLRRRASDAFVGAWDAWLQECMAASRAALGDRWLDVYLTSPAWRFTAAAGACGAAPLIGLMAPSVDRVGRYFPLTLVAELPPYASLIAAVTDTAPFFDRAERLVVDTLAAEHIDFESFDAEVSRLAQDLAAIATPPRVVMDPSAAAILTDAGHSCWQLAVGSPADLGPAFAQLLSHQLAAVYRPLTFWWTEGSANVEPSCLVAAGLPEPRSFAALLDGSWEQHRWRPAPVRVEAAEPVQEPLVDPTPLRFQSTAASDVGRVRAINEDSFVERPDIGLWAVADGLGGHPDGEGASRMVCDAFADFVQSPGFDDTVDAALDRVYEVNGHLFHRAARSLTADRSGSTVVALLTRGARCAVLWAGDSRAYRWRTGRLEQLTRDHSLEESGTAARRVESHAVTRAVGVRPNVQLDVLRDHVLPGDRFLLCSDGLTRTVPEARIRALMETPDIQAAVDGLIQATLDGGAPDNVTVLIAEACAD